MQRLYKILVEAGTDGLTQNEIVKRLQGSYSGPLILTVLEDWRQHEAVQKFTVDRVTRPATVWRATEKLLEEDMRNRNIIKDFYGTILKETEPDEREEGAVLFDYDEHEEAIWLPKKHIEFEYGNNADFVSLPKWLAEDKGMI